MACNTPSQVVPATTRDGADTRKKDNSVDARASNEVSATAGEATRLGAGDQVRGGQLAAGYAYLVPPITDVDRFDTWSRYIRNADDFVDGNIGYGDYSNVKKFCDDYIQELCDGLGENSEGFLNVHREFYNMAVTEWRRELGKDAESIHSAAMLCEEYLHAYNQELKDLNDAARVFQNIFRRSKQVVPPGVRVSETGTWIASEAGEEEAAERLRTINEEEEIPCPRCGATNQCFVLRDEPAMCSSCMDDHDLYWSQF